MQPREPHYAFVHVHLRDVAIAAPAQVWHVLMGPGAGAWLASRWLAMGGLSEDAATLGVIGQYRIGDHALLLLAMPQPLFPTEAHYVALARDPQGQVRYFVMEKAATGPLDPPRCFASEWRAGGMRVRYADLAAVTPQAFLDLLTEELAPANELTQPPTLTASIHPTYQTAPPAARPRTGTWVAVGLGALACLLFGGWFAWRRNELARYLAEQEQREAAVHQAEESLATVRERARTRRAALDRELGRCKKLEEARARETLDRAPERVARAQPPDNEQLVAGAIAYAPLGESGKVVTVAEPLPESAWIAKHKTACGALPPAVAELDAELARSPQRSDAGYVEQLATKARRIETLLERLAGVKIATPPAKSLVVVRDDCRGSVVASFTSTVSGRRLDLESYRCSVSLTWLSIPDAEVLGVVSVHSSARPKNDPGETTTDVALESLNEETRRAARNGAVEALQKQLARQPR